MLLKKTNLVEKSKSMHRSGYNQLFHVSLSVKVSIEMYPNKLL